MKAKWFSALLIVMVLAVSFVPVVGAAPSGNDNIPIQGGNSDNMGSPLANKQAALKQVALGARLKGQGMGKVQEVSNGQFVEMELERTDRIFVVIAEFGNTRHASFCDFGQTCAFPADGSAMTYEGPLHNRIPQPNRAADNTTLWQRDFSQAHYQNMYFNRMAAYYQSQSSGRYTVNGNVTEWVKVPFNEARYGRDYCGGIVCNNTWFLVRDAMAFWVKGRIDAGWTTQQVTDYLKTFDVWDRYDQDGDGIFEEPDGYIDHFQIVHSGGDQAAGDPQQGTDAIWSHRWYAQLIPIGADGPVVDGTTVAFGGFNAGIGGVSSGQTIPSNPTGVWVGDYTVQPENGGLGVFAHEFGHDAFGFPDLYDTSGNTCGSTCENSTGFWTLMSSGANIGDGGSKGIGDAPVDLGAWEKFQVGWLNYDVAFAGEESQHTLGPAEMNTKNPQALFVVLPDKMVESNIGDPFEGDFFYHSGSGNDLDNNMTRPVTLGAGPISLSFQANYHIEACWDYAYVEVSTDGGTTFEPIETSASTDANENGQNFGHGITGTSGTPVVCDEFGTPVWVPVTADLSAYANSTIQLRFRYWTDGAAVGDGFGVDNIEITGLATDGAETDAGWTYEGFSQTTGSTITAYFNAYVAEYRQYRAYDRSLRTAYNFGFLNTRPDWVETFPYQDGLLISYWDDSQTDNNTSSHPGEGLILPIDAHPMAMMRGDGGIWRSRMQSYDSTFTLAPTDAITLHWLGLASNHPSQPGVSVFDDANQYWNPLTPVSGVMNPHTDTTITIDSMNNSTTHVTVNGD